MNRPLRLAAFSAGLAVLAWVGAGYGHQPLALAVTGLIAAFYLMGALDLHRFRQATDTLAQAVAELTGPLPALQPWLARIHPTLQSPVRRRIEGEPVGLPGPALAPYLAGLLVLLGMLGTFLGMVLTLRGTGLALDSATDLQAVRTSLVAPVKGLGLAFGTSVAGVAASAALGLMSALCRRERLQAAQGLDAAVAGPLRAFSIAHQREASLQLQQRQAELLPALVDGLQAMMAAMERQAEAANARLLANQESFNGQAAAAYAGLAAAVDRTLKDSLVDAARSAGASIRPVVEATMAGIAREAEALNERLAGAAQRQSGELATRIDAMTARLGDAWQSALARHEQASQAVSEDLGGALERFAATFEQRSAALLETVARRQAEWQDGMAATMAGMARETASVQGRIAEAATLQLAGVATRLDETAQQVTTGWREALAHHERVGAQSAQAAAQALAQAAAGFEQHAAALLRTADRAQAERETASAARDRERLDTMARSIEAMAATLQREWQAAGAQALERQQQMCETMERTAREVSAQAEAHARGTVAEIARLVEVAAQAPRAAAEVIGELRQKLSESMARDNALLEERGRILETLGTLLEGVNQAATEQRGAIDALVATSADMLDRVGSRFGAHVEAETGKLAAVAAQVTGSAVEVASLGEAFGQAVQLFGESNDKLVTQLQRIDGALAKSMARSDEQLAYYVAQAREVVDLSILSQKQILEDLQRLSAKAAPAAALAR
jgi:hypothetical protein